MSAVNRWLRIVRHACTICGPSLFPECRNKTESNMSYAAGPSMRSFNTVVNRELLLDFFLDFSRFEYALKNSGYFVRHPDRPNGPPPEEPDWDSFAASVRDVFNASRSEELSEPVVFCWSRPYCEAAFLRVLLFRATRCCIFHRGIDCCARFVQHEGCTAQRMLGCCAKRAANI
jgi:hypothetical protein